MNEQALWMLARERQRSLREEACRLRGVPRPEIGFWAALWGKLSLGRARAQSTPTASPCCLEAACCVA
jgi:hypothetical protein